MPIVLSACIARRSSPVASAKSSASRARSSARSAYAAWATTTCRAWPAIARAVAVDGGHAARKLDRPPSGVVGACRRHLGERTRRARTCAVSAARPVSSEREEPVHGLVEQSGDVRFREIAAPVGGEELKRRQLLICLAGQRERLVRKLDTPCGLRRARERAAPASAKARRAGSRRALASSPAASRQCERLAVVVGEHLRMVFGAVAGEGSEPLRRAPVLLRALGARDLAVGDVSHERMEEGVLRLARDRRSGGRAGRTPSARARGGRARRCSARAPGQKTLPITDASWRSDFSAGASPSMRAAIKPCTVSGSARSPPPCSASIRAYSSA